MGPCTHTQCGFLHPSFFFLLSLPLTPAVHSLFGYASTLCRMATSPWLARTAKSNSCKDTVFAKIPFWGAHRDICCVRFLCTGRVQAESAPETEAAFFSFSLLFFCVPLLFCSQASWTELQERMQTLLLQHFPLLSKKGSSAVIFQAVGTTVRLVERRFLAKFLSREEREGMRHDTKRKKKQSFDCRTWNSTWFFNVFLTKELTNIWTCLVIASRNWWRLKGPVRRAGEGRQNVLASCGKKLFNNMEQVHHHSPLRMLLDWNMASLRAGFLKICLSEILYLPIIPDEIIWDHGHKQKKRQWKWFLLVLQPQLGKQSFRLRLGGEGWGEWICLCIYKCLCAALLNWESTGQFSFD